MTVLRPLRLLIPFVAIAAALGLFLGIGFIAFSTGGGGGRPASYGPCDAGLDSSATHRRVRAGRLHPVHRGVYAVGHPGLSFEGRWNTPSGTWSSPSLVPEHPSNTSTLS